MFYLAPALRRHRASQNIDTATNKTIGGFSLFQWMVAGQIGLSGHHVVKHVEMEYSREGGNVPTHLRPTVDQDVRETPLRSDPAIWELVQVGEIIVRDLSYVSRYRRLPFAMSSRFLPRKKISGL